MNGADSISPTVPPSSIIQISGSSLLSSTGFLATLSIQFWIALVMCGTT